ncbi:MAG: hypothetical protein ABSB15_14555 [Bryobacteraceae bacterium]|jgi:hypothetical protein
MKHCENEKPTRRAAIAMAGAGWFLCCAGPTAAADFWNRKQPSAWSNDEIQLLTTRSPWAKETPVQFTQDATYTTGGDEGPQVGNGGIISAPRSQSGGSFEMGGGGRDPRGEARSEPVVVRWESAQPILDALAIPLKNELKGRYVISVSNLPIGIMQSRRHAQNSGGMAEDRSPAAVQLRMIEELKGSATLEVRGKEPAQAGVVTTSPVAGTYLFGFSKELLTIAPSDKDVLFKLETGLMTVKAKFQPREMMYRGKLAL